MTEFIIDKDIIIDDIDAAMEEIAKISGKKVPAPETVRKFVNNEKNTKFYIDNKCACKMQPDKDTVYLWLDSGFTDVHGNPIMISMLKNSIGYSGHYCGTMKFLASSIKGYYSKNLKEINRNLANLKEKYEHKSSVRCHKHIEDEQAYLLQTCNDDFFGINMSDLLKNIVITTVETEANHQEMQPLEEQEEVNNTVILPDFDMNYREKEITVSLLLETIDGMQNYIDELLGEIEKFNTQDRVRLKELEDKNEEYKRALVSMRTFVENEAAATKISEATGFGGHELLGKNGKILVLGATGLDTNTMNGIAKLYGFWKNDFEFETDYKRVKNFTGRMGNGQRYSAIILGACPHKVAGLGDWSSIIEKCKKNVDMPMAFDARSLSGGLKVTKESFKTALLNICEKLRVKEAC